MCNACCASRSAGTCPSPHYAPAVQISYDATELPALIGQGGWTVEYRDWFGANEVAGSVLALPKRVFATHGATRVKLAIYDWSLGQ